jgi:hypothetical protein
MHKSQQECVMDFNNDDKPSLRNIIKQTCKRFNQKEKAAGAILYNKNGIQLLDEDVDFIKADDVLYIALDGKRESMRPAGSSVLRAFPQLTRCNTSILVFALCRRTVQLLCHS